MIEVADVGALRLVAPTRSAQQEPVFGQLSRRLQKELFHPRFAVRQAVAEESQFAVQIARREATG